MKNFIALLLCTSLLYSCDGTKRNVADGAIPVTGKVGEILVVCDEAIWDSELKICLDSNLTQFIMPYFPDVATFELNHKTPENFTGGFKRYRNTLFLNIDPNFKGKEGLIEKRIGVWATDQLVVDVTAGSFNQLVETCKKGLPQVHDEFDRFEWQRILKYHKSKPNHGIDEKLKDNFGIALALPNYAKLVTTRPNFYRITFPEISRPIEFVGQGGNQDNGAIQYGVMIYQYPFADSSQWELTNLLQARDTMLRYNVPSEVEGMYMGTQYVKLVYPEANTMTTQEGVSGTEVRGMFQFKGTGKHGTGGAFWSFHFVNPKTRKLICVSGYVDAPSTTSWTHPLRDIQAVLQSIKLI